MKKIKILIFSLIFLYLCACSGSTVTPVTRGLSFNAHVFYYNKEYTFAVNIGKDGNTELSVVEPQLLSGAKIVVARDCAYAEFRDIKYPVDLSRAGGAPYFLLECLKNADGTAAELHNEQFIISGTRLGEDYKIIFAESGIPLKIAGENIEIEICDAKILK